MRLTWLVGWLSGGLVGGLLGLSLLTANATAQTTTLTRGPYLQSTTRDRVIVVWQTDAPGDSAVAFGESGYTTVVSDTTPTTTHVVALTGLTAGATYQYQVETNGVALHQATLETAPDVGGDFSFVVIGDSGIGSSAQYDVAAQMAALQPDFMLHTGDVIYPSGQASGYDPYFFAPYGDLLDHVPVFPSLGNHDYGTENGQPYLDVFFLPANNSAGTERYYSFDWGDAHFVGLDSNLTGSARDELLQWLASDLAATTATWKLVFFHHALYTSGPHRNDSTLPALRAALAPIFEQYDVDVVFNGHDHDYERSKPINGVVYIVSGGGGAGLYALVPQTFSAFAASVHHTVEVQRTDCVLSLRAVDSTGAVIDQIALAKCPQRVYLPLILKTY